MGTENEKTRKPADQRSDVKNPNNNDHKLDKQNTEKQRKEAQEKTKK